MYQFGLVLRAYKMFDEIPEWNVVHELQTTYYFSSYIDYLVYDMQMISYIYET